MEEKSAIVKHIEEIIESNRKKIDTLAIACENFSFNYDEYIKDKEMDAALLKERMKEIVMKVINDEIR